jgi:adenosine/AMP kinase
MHHEPIGGHPRRDRAGRAILAVVDGGPPLGVETDEDVKARKELHRKIGYKL